MDEKLKNPLSARHALQKIYALIEADKDATAGGFLIIRWVLIAILVLVIVFLIAAKRYQINAPEKKCLMDGQSVACNFKPFADKSKALPDTKPAPMPKTDQR